MVNVEIKKKKKKFLLQEVEKTGLLFVLLAGTVRLSIYRSKKDRGASQNPKIGCANQPVIEGTLLLC